MNNTTTSFFRTLGLLTFATTVLFFGFHQEAKASHAMGVDITYTCVPGGNTYDLTLNFYRDCAGISAPSSVWVDVSSATCGFSTSVNLTMSGACTEVSPLCPAALAQSKCVNITNPNPGVQLCTYTGNVDLGTNYCNDFVFSFGECCRNAAITNLNSPDSYDQYVEATLDNSTGDCANSSPSFFSLPTPYICANQPFNYNHGAVDMDGDSLSYTFCNALDNATTPISYAPGYSPTNPISSVPPAVMDAISGQMTMNPDIGQFAVVTMCIEEWRLSPPAPPTLIGTTMRDLQVVALTTCSNVQPEIDSIENCYADGVRSPTNLYGAQVCAGDSIAFDFIATDANADNITLTSNVAFAIPDAYFSTTPVGPVVTGTFEWQTTTADVGFNSFVVQTNDDGCPVLGANFYVFTIEAIGRTNAGPDIDFCVGTDVTLTAFGGNTFSWRTLSGDPVNVGTNFSCNPCTSPVASPNQTTTYEVTSDLSGSCINKDTITLNSVTVLPNTINYSYNRDTVCRGDTTQVGVTLDPTSGTATYAWSPAGVVNNPNIPNPVCTVDTDVRLAVTVTDGACTDTASHLFVVNTSVSVSADTVGVCDALDSIRLLADVTGTPLPGVLSCGTNGTAIVNPVHTETVGTGALSTGTGTPYEGFWHDGRIQILYHAADLVAAGMTKSGTITEIAFNVAVKGSSAPYNTFTIKMGCTLDTDISTWYAGLSTVLGPTSISTVAGWNTHALTSPFDWDGTSNIVVEVCYDNTGYTSDDDIYYTTTTYNSVIYEYADFDAGCAFATFVGPTTNRPNTRFTISDAPPGGFSYTWSPTTALSNPNVADPKALVNLGSPVTYYVTVTGGPCPVEDSVLATCETCGESVRPYIIGSVAVDTAQYLSDSTFRIQISEPILCSTIDPSGNDFMLDCTSTSTTVDCNNNSVIAAAGVGCVNDTARWIFVELDNPTPMYTYDNDWRLAVALSAGITDTCNNPIDMNGVGAATGAPIILPIELLTFNAKLTEDNDVLLTWLTASEKDVEYFEVERSFDGKHFDWVGTRNATGNGSSYNLVDRNPFEGINYYRLKIYETTGFKYSDIIDITVNKNASFNLINTRPIPTIDNLIVTFNTQNAESIKIEVINLLGETVMNQEVKSQQGPNEVTLQLRSIEAGVYYLNIYNEQQEKIVKKFIKQ